MGPWGAIIMGFFGSCYFAWAGVLAWGVGPVLLLPLAVFAVIALLAWRRIGSAAPGAYAPPPRAAKVMSWSSAAEGTAIPVVVLALVNTGHGAQVLPAIAAIVGLHFLPMAWAIPFRPFYASAALLLAASVIGFLLGQPAGSIVAGEIAALTLWSAAAFALRRAG
jgi:uncharacterized membrane protein